MTGWAAKELRAVVREVRGPISSMLDRKRSAGVTREELIELLTDAKGGFSYSANALMRGTKPEHIVKHLRFWEHRIADVLDKEK